MRKAAASLVINLTIAVVYGHPQATVPRLGHPPVWPPGNGTSYFSLTPPPSYQPESLMELEKRSTLIIDAIVDTVLPARVLNTMLETDVILLANQVLKGPTTVQKIVVTQRGGVHGEYRELPMQYSLMQKGERYIVFATEDKRENMPPVSDQIGGGRITRYWITGEWVGGLHTDGVTVHLNSGVPKVLSAQYDGMSLREFISQTTTVIKRR